MNAIKEGPMLMNLNSFSPDSRNYNPPKVYIYTFLLSITLLVFCCIDTYVHPPILDIGLL